MKLVIFLFIFFSYLPSSLAQMEDFRELLLRGQKTFVSESEIQKLYGLQISHPVARTDRVSKYDPEGLIGFCFGRSMTGALMASSLGLDFSQMQHIFIVGDLRRPGAANPEWRFHVSFVVPDEQGNLWALDPIIPEQRPVLLGRWIQFVQRTWDRKKDARLYLTSGSAVMPNSLEIIKQDRNYPLLIDIDFDPKEFEGFQSHKRIVPGQEIFTLSPEAERDHFLTLYEGDQSPFNLRSLNFVDGPHINFNGYFLELIDSFKANDPSKNPWKMSPIPRLQSMGGLSGRIFEPIDFRMNRCEQKFFPRVF